MGCILDQARPTSPTAVTDFPGCDTDPTCVHLTEHLQLQVLTKTILPKVKTLTGQVTHMVATVDQAMEGHTKEQGTPPTKVMTPTMVADIGRIGHTYVTHNVGELDKGKTADSGANCCMTNNSKLLDDIKLLTKPIQVGMALEKDGSHLEMMICKHVGILPVECDDGHIIHIQCFYNPYA